MKKKLGEIRVRIVNMRSANFTEIREGLEGQKYNFLKLSFCDKEEKITVPIGDNKEATWTTENLIDTYHNLEPQADKFHQSDIICPIVNYQRVRNQSEIYCPVNAFHKLNSQSADIYLFITDYKVLNGNYGGSCDDKQTYFYLSLYGITDYLRNENIRLSNFVQIAIYRDVLRYLCGKRIAHDKTKKCIFDTNSAERAPFIAKSCVKPKICRECKDKIKDIFNENEIPIEYLMKTEKALRKLKKGLYYRIKDYINNYPFLSVIITIGSIIILPIVINLLSSYIYDYLTK